MFLEIHGIPSCCYFDTLYTRANYVCTVQVCMWYGDSLYSSEQLCYAGFVKRCWWYSSRKGSFLIRQIRKGVTNIYWKGNCYISTCLVQVLLCVCVEFESKTLAVDLIILRGLKHMILKTKGKLWKINWKHSELYMCRRKIKVAWYKKKETSTFVGYLIQPCRKMRNVSFKLTNFLNRNY